MAFGPSLTVLAPPSPCLSFLAVGDWGRRGTEAQRAVAQGMARAARRLGSAFVLTTDDNFYEGGVESTDDAHSCRMPSREALGAIHQLIEAGPFRVRVARTFGLEEAAEAHQALSEHYLGKLALTVERAH